jgi:protein-S-isoprenylcysteine O-methyltransferase Ste14
MVAADIVIAVVWVAFWLYWLASAVTAKSANRAGRGAYAGMRVALIVAVFLLLRLHVFRGRVLPDTPWLLALGLLLFFGGLGLAVWARVYIGRNWGTPMSQKDNPDLVTTGPYRKIRHPIYTGIITAMIGTALATSLLWLALAVILGGYFIFSATREEKYMASQFPATYPAYKRSTKMLIPYIL